MKYLSALALAGAIALGSAAGATTISNTPTGGSISSFGFSDTLTYGQVFEAPVTGTMTSFTMYLDGGVGGDILGAVGTWNGTPAHGFGFGSPTTLYTSGLTDATSGGAFTFATAISVVAGDLYVAFLTAFGTSATGTTSMPLGDDLPGGSYFVWNNTSDPFGNPSWNYFFATGDALFSATFVADVAPVPVPAGLPLMLLALGGLGVAARRRRS